MCLYLSLSLLFFLSQFFASCDKVVNSNVNERKQFFDIISNEKFVFVLFSEPCCKCTDCVEAEARLAAINAQLLQQQVVTVKFTSEDDLARTYGVTKRPSLIFLRTQQPVLYDGKFDEEEILEWLSRSQEANVQELNDETFEHLTQAATGATTGDWLVTFFDSQCKHHVALRAVSDSVALRLKGRSNVALVNCELSPELTERFSIKKCPTTIFFRLGKMFLYDFPSFTPELLRSFAEGFYRNAKSVPVPKVPSPFDKLVKQTVQHLKTHSWIPWAALLMLLLLCSAFLLFARKNKTE